MNEIERAKLRVDCARIAIENGSKQGIEKDACLGIAEKIYSFVVGESPKAPKKQSPASG